ncbi:MAG: nucleoid-associated protein YgaU [Maribacter sp.]|jgi:nucleoid-associated protein YgaU
MGLFSFFKKAGSKVLVEEEQKAATSSMAKDIANKAKTSVMHSVVESLKLPIENLDIALADDVVTVYGTTDSHDNREKIVLVLGNVHGIATVDDRITVVVPPPISTFYTVEKGDSLSKIAKKVYGDPMKYPIIFEANKPMLKDPSLIYPGQSLRIPNLTA